MDIQLSGQDQWVFLAAVAAFAVFNLWKTVSALWLARQAQTWPRVPAQVLDAGVAARTIQGVRHFVPTLLYTFEAEGRTVRGNRLRFGHAPLMTRERAEDAARRLADNPLVIAYRPGNPDQCVVEAKAGVVIPAMWAVGSAFVAATVLWALSLPG